VLIGDVAAWIPRWGKIPNFDKKNRKTYFLHRSGAGKYMNLKVKIINF